MLQTIDLKSGLMPVILKHTYLIGNPYLPNYGLSVTKITVARYETYIYS